MQPIEIIIYHADLDDGVNTPNKLFRRIERHEKTLGESRDLAVCSYRASLPSSFSALSLNRAPFMIRLVPRSLPHLLSNVPPFGYACRLRRAPGIECARARARGDGSARASLC